MKKNISTIKPIQVRTRPAVQLSGQEAETFFNISPDLVCMVSHDGYFTHLNPAWEQTLDYSLAELMNKPFSEFIHPDDRQSSGDKMTVIFNESKGVIKFINRFRCSDGSYKWLEWNGAKSNGRNVVYCIARDITERKMNEEIHKDAEKNKLLRSEQKYKKIFDSIRDVYVRTDLNGNIVEISPSIERSFHYSMDELIGTPVRIIYADPRDRTILLNILAEKGEVLDYELKLKDKSGEHVWSSINIHYSYDIDGQLIGQEGLVRVIEQRKKAEEVVKKSEALLKKLIAEKDKFLSIIAHDLAGPMNELLTMTEKIEERFSSMPPEMTLKMIRLMGKSVAGLYNLLENLLEWSKVQMGATTVTMESFLLKPLVLKHLESIQVQAQNKNLTFSINIPEDLQVYCDEKIMMSIIRNLASNAVKFTPDGGKVSLSATPEIDNKILIRVKDTGIGFKKEIIKDIYNVGFIGQPGCHGEQGNGLGLALTREFIDKIGESIRIKSTVGKGSEFSFTVAAKPDKMKNENFKINHEPAPKGLKR